jgi:hypothetical protein
VTAPVTSDAHTGLKAAIGSVLLGAAWQRCRIHATRNLLAAVPKGHADMVAAAVRTIFAQPGAPGVRSQPGVIAGMLGRKFPKVEATQIAQGTRSRPSTPRTSSKPDRCATTNGQLLAGKTARRSSGGPPTRTWRPWPNKSSA